MENIIIIKNKKNRVKTTKFIFHSLANLNNLGKNINDFINKLRQRLGFYTKVKNINSDDLNLSFTICFKYNENNIATNVTIPFYYFI